MKIHSNYLNKDYEIPDLSHSSIERLFYNELSGVMCEYKIKEVGNHPVIICSIQDDRGRKIHAIGEATVETLESFFEKNNPAVVASQRAFCKAVELYLDFVANAENENDSSRVISYSEDEEKTELNVASAPININEDETEDPVNESAEELVEETSANNESSPVVDCVITIGKYKGKESKASEVVATDKAWVEYIVSKFTNVNGTLLEQVNSLKYFLSKE